MRFSICAFLFLLILSFVLLSCTQPQSEEAIQQMFDSIRIQWTEGFNGGDAASISALYVDDAKLLPPNNETISGKQEIQNYYSWTTPGGQTITIETLDTHYKGDLACGMGTYNVTVQQEGQVAEDKGKWINVIKQQPDGTWKVVYHIWNSDLPVPVQ